MITNEIPFDTACDLALLNVSFIACIPQVSQFSTKGGTQLCAMKRWKDSLLSSMLMNIVIVQEM